MNFSRVVTALLAAALLFFANGAESLPRFQTPMFSPQYLQADTKCVLVNGQPVCTNKSGDKHKKKKNDDRDALTECTIQQGAGGGGCGPGLKSVCQKLKNGKKCCGCVPDKSAGQPAPAPAPAPVKSDCKVLGPNEGSAGGAADPKLKFECTPLSNGNKECCWVQYP